MNKIILLLLMISPGSFAFAQDDTTKPNNIDNYWSLKNFLALQKNQPTIFETKIKPQWNSKLYQQQYQQLLTINKKKEFYPEFMYDSRFISQSFTSRHGSQNYMWVPTQQEYKNLGEQIASDVIGGVVDGFINSKKKRFSSSSKKGYYTPAGLKY